PGRSAARGRPGRAADDAAPPPPPGSDDSEAGTQRPWWRRRGTVLVTAAASALVIAGGTVLALAGLPFPGQEPAATAGPGADPSSSPDPGGEPSDGPPEVELSGFMYDLVFSDDGETLYVYGGSTLSAWDWREGVPIDTWEPTPTSADITSSGYVASAADGYVEVWEGSSDNRVAVVGRNNGDRGFYDYPALTDDGSRLAVLASEDGTYDGDRLIQIWDVESDTAEVDIPVEGIAFDLDFTRDGSLLVGMVVDHEWDAYRGVFVWDTATGQELYRISGDGRYSFTLSPDDSTMAVVNGDNRAWIVDTATGATVRELAPVGEEHELIHDLAFSSDGGRVLAGAYGLPSSRSSVWDAATGELLREGEILLYDPIGVHPDGEHVATAVSDTGEISVLILDSGFTIVSELS
uniref:WD40 repeat domain-containing protein n=1 Tax=Nocardiopsis lucentensis TaxID=53441 RepID=UPI00035C3E99